MVAARKGCNQLRDNLMNNRKINLREMSESEQLSTLKNIEKDNEKLKNILMKLNPTILSEILRKYENK
jgi:hypothetical protein